MELIKLIEELEGEVEEASRIPMTGKIFLDEEIILDYLDRLRAAIPEEIKQAQWITKERERILSDAQAEAEKIINQTTSYIDEQACNSEIVKKAETTAQEIVLKAKFEAEQMEQQSKEYALNVFQKMEDVLDKAISTVQEGKSQL